MKRQIAFKSPYPIPYCFNNEHFYSLQKHWNFVLVCDGFQESIQQQIYKIEKSDLKFERMSQFSNFENEYEKRNNYKTHLYFSSCLNWYYSVKMSDPLDDFIFFQYCLGVQAPETARMLVVAGMKNLKERAIQTRIKKILDEAKIDSLKVYLDKIKDPKKYRKTFTPKYILRSASGNSEKA